MARIGKRWWYALGLLPVGLLTFPAGAQTQRAKPVVTAAAQVTDDPNPVRAHSSPQIAANPKTGELVIAETDVYQPGPVAIHVSADDGRSWFDGGSPILEPYTWTSDFAINGPYATMTFDRDGILYLAFSATDPRHAALNRSKRPRSIFLATSSDSGRTWRTGFVFEAPQDDEKLLDNRRPMVAVDPSDRRYVYVGWMQPGVGSGAGVVAASADGGKTFGKPVVLGEETRRHYQPRIAVDGSGVLHAVFPSGEFTPDNPPVRPAWYRRSSDHGKTWSPARVIEPGSALFFHGRKHLLAADPNSNTLHFIWYGSAKERPGPQDDNDIFVRVSTDGGKSWSDRRTVNDDAHLVNVQHYDPGIAVAPTGRVDVAWYDFRNSPTPETLPEKFEAPFNVGGYQDVYYSSSSNRGRTWRENIRISDRLIDRNVGVWSNNVHSHYNVGIASTADSVYFVWQDSRNGNSVNNVEDVYFAALKLNGSIEVTPTSGVPPWMLLGAGFGVGLALAIGAVLLFARRQMQPAPGRVPG